MSEPFIAEIKIWAGNFAPRGYAFCDGQLLPIAQNTALFALIGTIYGGDGRTTLGLPDLQGRAPMHPGNGPGLTTRRLGEKGGAVGISLVPDQVPSHSHALMASDADATSGSPTGNLLAVRQEEHFGAPGNPVPMAADALSDTGGLAHNNMQPFLGLSFIIALLGVFPSRA